MPKQKLQCPFCPKTSSRGTGLASHIRGAHPKQYSGWSRSRKSVQNAEVGKSSPKVVEMAGGLGDIIARLERQKTAIERALAALREVEGTAAPVSAPATTQPASAPAKRKGDMTPEGRKRLAEAMKRRWAVKRTAAQARKRGR